MRLEWIGTEGRGWNWGYALTIGKTRLRARVLSWAPFVRVTVRSLAKEQTVEGAVFPSDAPHTPPSPAKELWSAYDRRIRQKHNLLVRN